MNILYKYATRTSRADFRIGMAFYNNGYDPIYESNNYFEPKSLNNVELVLFKHASTRHMIFNQYKNANNYWFIKNSYVSAHFERDKKGYSGYSGFNELNLTDLINGINNVDLRANIKKWDEYISSNTSKYPQSPIIDTSLMSKTWKFIGNSDFIFFAGQTFNDSVIRHSNFGDYKNTILKAFNVFKDLDVKFVYKPHPDTINNGDKDDVDFLKELLKLEYKNIYISLDNHSIHELIDRSIATITINSGVGFEAIMHKKPVFSLGSSDYTFISKELKTLDDLKNISVNKPDDDKYNRFLYVYDKMKLFKFWDEEDVIDALFRKEWSMRLD